jgi:hypothetical protein
MDDRISDDQMAQDFGALADRLAQLPAIAPNSEIDAEIAAILERLRGIAERNEKLGQHLAVSLGLISTTDKPLQ